MARPGQYLALAKRYLLRTPYMLEYPEQVGAWEGRAMQPGFGKMPSAAYKTD